MAQTALMIMALVVAGVVYMGPRVLEPPKNGIEQPLIPTKVYVALLAAGLVLAILLH